MKKYKDFVLLQLYLWDILFSLSIVIGLYVIYVIHIENPALCDDGGFYLYDLKNKLVNEYHNWLSYKNQEGNLSSLRENLEYLDSSYQSISIDKRISEAYKYSIITMKNISDINNSIQKIEPDFNMWDFLKSS